MRLMEFGPDDDSQSEILRRPGGPVVEWWSPSLHSGHSSPRRPTVFAKPGGEIEEKLPPDLLRLERTEERK